MTYLVTICYTALVVRSTATGVFVTVSMLVLMVAVLCEKKDEYIVATASGTLAGLVGTYTIKATPPRL